MSLLSSEKLRLILFNLSLLLIFNITKCSSRYNSRVRIITYQNATIEELEVSPTSEKPVQCQDEDGNDVPWFIAYKLPKVKTASGSTFRQGTGYSYILPGNDKWKPSVKPIGNLNSIVGRTLRPFIDSTSDILSVVYNDQPPYRENSIGTNGHSKGIVLSNGSGGIWLMHSVPRFPLAGNEFYPSNGLVNGQMFLCLTLSADQIDSIGYTFEVVRPYIVNASLPEQLKSTFPSIQKFLETKRFKTTVLNGTSTLSVGKLNFQVFAKSPKFEREIFMDWLAPTLQSSLDVQSWLIGRGVLKSNCDEHDYQVYNIAEKRIDGKDFSKSDHSKWAVTAKDSQVPWVCVSDLNRMEGQMSRGGATVCISNSVLWRAFNSAILDLEPCDLPNKG